MSTYYFNKELSDLKVIFEPSEMKMETNPDGTVKVSFVLPVKNSPWKSTCEIEFLHAEYEFTENGIKLTLC